LLPSLTAQRFPITGGTGSFGQTMVVRLLNAGAEEGRVLSRDEAKKDDMRRRLRDDRVRLDLGDARKIHPF
jgi:UDP-glucose 4-epimerase